MPATQRALIVLVVAASVLVPAAPVEAAFPGGNGKIAFVKVDVQFHRYVWTVDPNGGGETQIAANSDEPEWMPDGSRLLVARAGSTATEIWSINPDGTNATFIAVGNSPAPSPDGRKIAFEAFPPEGPSSEIYVMNADGTGATQLTSEPDAATRPAWSPDGTSIAFNRPGINGGVGGIYRMNADGTNQVMISPGSTRNPNWSPDGTKIVHECGPDPAGDICVMDRNGDGETNLTPGPSGTSAHFPAWSPDGTKIVFYEPRPGGGSRLVTINPDGTGKTEVVAFPWNATVDWQPIPLNYARPRGATPFLTYLVPAYGSCAAPNRTHGSPLVSGSCTPPSQASSNLTVGTPDANGKGAKAIAAVSYRVRPGNPVTPANEADVNLAVAISDVRKQSDLSDYTGELRLTADLRVTDRDNTPYPGGPGPGTVQDTSLPFTFPCTATADDTIGASCRIQTTANALYPGIAQEGKRTIWQLGQVQVYDGGSDGLASTTADNTLFMDQGIFVP